MEILHIFFGPLVSIFKLNSIILYVDYVLIQNFLVSGLDLYVQASVTVA